MMYKGKELEPIVFKDLERGDTVVWRCNNTPHSVSIVLGRLPTGEVGFGIKVAKGLYNGIKEALPYDSVITQEITSGTLSEKLYIISEENSYDYYLVSKAKPKDDFWWQDETQQGTLARALRETYEG